MIQHVVPQLIAIKHGVRDYAVKRLTVDLKKYVLQVVTVDHIKAMVIRHQIIAYWKYASMLQSKKNAQVVIKSLFTAPIPRMQGWQFHSITKSAPGYLSQVHGMAGRHSPRFVLPVRLKTGHHGLGCLQVLRGFHQSSSMETNYLTNTR